MDELRDLSDFFENAAVALHWVGPDGTILRVNKAELELLGYAREEYVGRNIAEFHVDPPAIADILKRLKAGETLHNYEARLRCKDGSIRDVLITSNVQWRDGKFVHTRFDPAGFTGAEAHPIAQSIVDYVATWMAIEFLAPDERVAIGVTGKAHGSGLGAGIGLGEPRRTPSPTAPASVVPSPVASSAPARGSLDVSTASACRACGSTNVQRTGACETCRECGSTTSCG